MTYFKQVRHWGPTSLFLMAFLSMAAWGCSAALDWDVDGLACDTEVVDGRTDFCLQGYSCLAQSDSSAAGRCVRDTSLKMGDNCSSTRQCAANEVCPVDLLAGGGVAGSDGIKLCYAACNTASATDPYYTSSACNSGYICMPFLNSRAIDPNKSLVGACLPSTSCTSGAACTTPSVSAGTCVEVAAGENACLTGCEITWSAAQTYSDNCDSLHGCQPVGGANAQEFVCVYNGVNSTANPLATINGQAVAAIGAACSVLEKPCAKGAVCDPTGVCSNYCQITSNNINSCPTGDTCCPFSSFATSQLSGFCHTGTGCP